MDYWVIGLAPDYSWAVVTDPDGDLLYIISKTPTLPTAQFNEALKVAAQQRDISQIQLVTHQGCSYPEPRF
jgi:lipocalin